MKRKTWTAKVVLALGPMWEAETEEGMRKTRILDYVQGRLMRGRRWKIDTAFDLDTEDGDCGIGRPIEVTSHGYREGMYLPAVFRLMDDDGNVYFLGRAETACEFEPLDDYGMPDSGCTTIQYWNYDRHEWETL